MPKGIDVLVEEGFATIDFVDRRLRGQGIAALLEHTPAELVEKITRSGPRALYRVPEGNAREAGMLDGENTVDHLADREDTKFAQQLVDSDPWEGKGVWSQPRRTVKGNAYVNGRDGANGAIQGPLRPNQPTGTPPARPAAATESASELQARIKASTRRPADYQPKPYEKVSGPPIAVTRSGLHPARPASTVESAPVEKASTAATYDDGKPDMDWSRSDMDAYAEGLGLDPKKFSNKEKLLAAIRAQA